MEQDYEIKEYRKTMSVAELKEGYFRPEQFEALCRKCPKYGMLWSCPPYDFSTEEYLGRYKTLTLVGTQVILSEELRQRILSPREVAQLTEELLDTIRQDLDGALLREERELEGCRLLASGGCRLCSRCARPDGIPCRQRGRMRYSLESLGCDVTALVQDKLGLSLLWADRQLPEYFVLVNGLLLE